MKRLRFRLSVGLLLATSLNYCVLGQVAQGQEAELGQPAPIAISSQRANVDEQADSAPSMVSPEIYLYLQEQKRHDDPAQAVRRKAEARSYQRMSRLAALKWYGFSNARPQASTVPMMGVYSPTWVGNGYDRYDWSPSSGPTIVLRVHSDDVRR